jgi:hypothetical protein
MKRPTNQTTRSTRRLDHAQLAGITGGWVAYTSHPNDPSTSGYTDDGKTLASAPTPDVNRNLK